MKYMVLYVVGVMSLIAAILTIYDKRAATDNPRHRVRESVLLFVAALGGSAVMYITMRLIHHKTKHAKFMMGIPVIIVLQAAIAIYFHFIR